MQVHEDIAPIPLIPKKEEQKVSLTRAQPKHPMDILRFDIDGKCIIRFTFPGVISQNDRVNMDQPQLESDFTLQEIFSFIQSTVSSQKALGLQILTSIIKNIKKEVYPKSAGNNIPIVLIL